MIDEIDTALFAALDAYMSDPETCKNVRYNRKLMLLHAAWVRTNPYSRRRDEALVKAVQQNSAGAIVRALKT